MTAQAESSPSPASQADQSLWSWRGVKLVLLAWLAMLGFDFLLHGGLLAGLYAQESPFLLGPREAFARIPIGYLSFLISAGFLVWLASTLRVRTLRRGLRVGAALGGIMWVTLALGLYSITTGEPRILVAWAVGQTLEMAYGGAIVGYALGRSSLRRPLLVAMVLTVVLVSLTVAMQSVGLVQITPPG